MILRGAQGVSFALTEDTAPNPDGVVLALGKGARGLGAPEFEVHRDDYPGLDGGFVRSVRASGREIFLPILMAAPTRPELVYLKRSFIRAINPQAGLIRLSAAEYTVNGTREPARFVDCYYGSGMEGEENEDGDLTWTRFGLVLHATDPFFRAESETSVRFVKYNNLTPFLKGDSEPFLGGGLVSSDPQFNPQVEVDNTGDIPAYPTWYFEGPIEGPLNLVREVPGAGTRVLRLTDKFLLGPGQRAEIVTDPTKIQVTSTAGNILWSALDTNPDFWALEPGINTVRVEGEAPISPTGITLTYRAGYMSM